MTFPSANTAFVWRMNDTDFAIGVLDYANEGMHSLDRFESISEFTGTELEAVAKAKNEFPEFTVEVVTATGALAVIDQFSAELRDATFSEDESLNAAKLSF